jgi:multiple sugar transport system substrate-binding protein
MILPSITAVARYYVLDGEEVEWNWDTLAQVSQILTVDSNGNDATMDEFDPSSIEQFGFVQQWSTQRADFSTFGGGYFYEDGNVSIPPHWRAQAQWQYDALWNWHITPTATYEASQLFQPSAFASGRVAMARVQLWYTCCLGDLTDRWDLGVVPSYEGVAHAPVDADTYRILKTSANPEAAFTVMSYLLGDAALELLQTYGGFPARADIQDSFISALSERYPNVQNWSVIQPSLEHAAVPNHEYDYPGFNIGQQRFADFRTLLFGETGADIDLQAELDRLEADLQAIVDQAS